MDTNLQNDKNKGIEIAIKLFFSFFLSNSIK